MANCIRFETLKNRAKKAIGYTASDRTGLGGSNLGWLHSTAFESLAYVAINFKQYVSNERPQLVEFAKAYQAGQFDTLAQVAKCASEKAFAQPGALNELALQALKAREEALKIIDAWDVRCVSSLIKLFPEIVSKKQLKSDISLEMEDKEDASWLVCFS